jgi:hypothetical protein
MTKLESQYQDFCKENPDSQISYDQWVSARFSYPTKPIHNLRPMKDIPWVDEDVQRWDESQRRRLKDIPWIDED